MANLLVGDIHGCFRELQALLAQADFTPDRDTLWLTGDLVARGPDSLQVLRYVKSIAPSVRLVLGNHDLHLLSIYAGIGHNNAKDNLSALLAAPDADQLINWLRHQPLIQVDHSLKLIMTHAGLSPQWDLETALQCAHDVQTMLSSDSYPLLLDAMYGDLPNIWSNTLSGLPRLRYITNALTRIRYCFPNGQLEMQCKESPAKAPAPLRPWFNLPSPIRQQYRIAFGHWAALAGKYTPDGVYALDTGCCWGKSLTLLHWEDQRLIHQPAFKNAPD